MPACVLTETSAQISASNSTTPTPFTKIPILNDPSDMTCYVHFVISNLPIIDAKRN